jgi:hypothetical protein
MHKTARLGVKWTLTGAPASLHTERVPSDQGAGATKILNVIAQNTREQASTRGI